MADIKVEEAVSDLMRKDYYDFLVEYAQNAQGQEAGEFAVLLEDRKNALVEWRDGFLRNNVGKIWLSLPLTMTGGLFIDLMLRQATPNKFAHIIAHSPLHWFFYPEKYNTIEALTYDMGKAAALSYIQNGGSAAVSAQLYEPNDRQLATNSQHQALKNDVVEKMFIAPAVCLVVFEFMTAMMATVDSFSYDSIQGDKQIERIEILEQIMLNKHQ